MENQEKSKLELRTKRGKETVPKRQTTGNGALAGKVMVGKSREQTNHFKERQTTGPCSGVLQVTGQW